MYGGGRNNYGQLFLPPNDYVVRLANTDIDILQLNQVSIGFYQSVYITAGGRAFAAGGDDKHTFGIFERGKKTKKQVELKFSELAPNEKFVQVQCGEIYVALLTDKGTVVYCTNSSPPLFFTDISNPLLLKGNCEFPIVIDTMGLFHIFQSPDQKSYRSYCCKEPIIDVALLRQNNRILALGKSGAIYSCYEYDASSAQTFEKVKFENKKKFVMLSGMYQHCVAISDDGCAFSVGSNKYKQLGPNIHKEYSDTFQLISMDYFFIHAAVGYSHTHLLTRDGNIILIGQVIFSSLGNLKGPFSYEACGPYSAFLFKNWRPKTILYRKKKKRNFNDDNNGNNSNNNNIALYYNGFERLSDKVEILKSNVEKKKKELDELKDLEVNPKTKNEEIQRIKNLAHSIKRYERLNSRVRKQNKLLNEQLKAFDIVKQNPVEKIEGVAELNEYTKIKTIGQGGYAKVDKVIHEKSGYKYAMKTIFCFDEQSSKTMIREFELLSQFQHPCIVALHKFSLGDGRSYNATIILEYVKHTLDRVMSHGNLSNTRKCMILTEIVLGMRYVHSIGIIHRDIKPANILLTKDYHVKICDFGLATSDEMSEKSERVGTEKYMAPEIYRKETNYGPPVDVFSFGMCAFFILVGEMPNKTVYDVAVKNELPTIPNYLPLVTRNILALCLKNNPNERLTFEGIFNAMEKADFKLLSSVEESFIKERVAEILEFEKKLILQNEDFQESC